VNTEKIGGARTPWHLWLVGIAALLFNAMGVLR